MLADVAAVLADPSRATMCLALIDGRAWTVGELARAAGIAPSTASEHVGVLAKAGFVRTLKQGRHRYVRLEGPDVAELIEKLSQYAGPERPKSLRASIRARRLAAARTCYDHLAGRLGVAIRDGMLATGLLDDVDGLHLTRRGRTVLEELGVELHRTRRPVVKDCLDWTERREHLSGAMPAALLDRALAAGWLARDPTRAIRVHPAAGPAFERLGVDERRARSIEAPDAASAYG
ncbi:MAG TPA: metalloregulator ArsR/SmtB family transcription factor [Actinophytocola sp.]|jgi:DNA-binding transcriptional ArsR family regulator|uniref:ArsR/SmtB family transcription factor n=1 Tax=Actinophytocola sp. TaxID=1872138 RepID=UPI002F929C02